MKTKLHAAMNVSNGFHYIFLKSGLGYLGSVLLLEMLFVFPGRSQNLDFVHYNTNNSGLTHDIVYCLNQDDKGYLWIGTDDGLVRFDGMQMARFETGLVSKYVIDSDQENGRIWITAWKGGIQYLKGDSFYQVTSPDHMVIYKNHILVFDDLVIAHSFRDYSVYVFEEDSNMLRPYLLKRRDADECNFLVKPRDQEYYGFLKTISHQLYAYNHRGIYRVVNKTLELVTDRLHPHELWESQWGELYYREGAKIYRTDEEFSFSELKYEIPLHRLGNTINSFKVLPSGNICIGIAGNDDHMNYTRWFLGNTATGEIYDLCKEIKAEVFAADLLVDREGGIWLSTDGYGIYHIFDPRYFLMGAGRLPDNSNVTSLFLTGDTLLIGTKEGAYAYMQNQLKLVTPKDYFVKRFYRTFSGEIAVTSKNRYESYVIFPKMNRSLYTYVRNFTHYRFEDHGESSCLTDRSGQIVYIPSNEVPSLIQVMEEDDKRNLWIGTTRGLFYFNPETGLKWFEDELLKKCVIKDLLYEPGKGLWIATDNGLYLANAPDQCIRWDKGPEQFNVNCLHMQSPGSLWIGTQNGLYNQRGENLYLFRKRDGLIADDISCIEAISDYVLAVGSSKGITFVDTRILPPVPTAPELLIWQFLVNGRSHQWQPVLDLPFKSSISLSYNVVTFIYPELLTFEYRLNLNEPWIATSNKSLVFTNLGPGNYYFQLRANKYNSSLSQPIGFSFTIRPPWWGTWYFYVFLLLIGLSSFFLFSRFLLKKQKAALKLRQEFSELRLKALQAQLNPHFLSNALSAIQLFTLRQDILKVNEYLSQIAGLTRCLLEASRTGFISLKEELEILLLYIGLEQLRLEDRFSYWLDLDPSIDTENVFLPGTLIQPFVENSINHGILYLDKNIKGKLEVRIQKYGSGLKIIIDDNGIGRQQAEKIKSSRKQQYKSRSTAIAGEIQVAVNNLPGCSVRIETLDKVDSHNAPCGTQVVVFIVISPHLQSIKL